MLHLNSKQIEDYYFRSYTGVDGLWFMKAEDKYGFEAALAVDKEVWKVVPKIQARMLKSMGNTGDGIDALFECFTTKLTLDRFQFRTEKLENGFKVIITRCHWYDLLVKSKRQALAERIATHICNAEYSGWAAEFGSDILVQMQGQLCTGAESCILHFSQGKE